MHYFDRGHQYTRTNESVSWFTFLLKLQKYITILAQKKCRLAVGSSRVNQGSTWQKSRILVKRANRGPRESSVFSFFGNVESPGLSMFMMGFKRSIFLIFLRHGYGWISRFFSSIGLIVPFSARTPGRRGPLRYEARRAVTSCIQNWSTINILLRCTIGRIIFHRYKYVHVYTHTKKHVYSRIPVWLSRCPNLNNAINLPWVFHHFSFSSTPWITRFPSQTDPRISLRSTVAFQSSIKTNDTEISAHQRSADIDLPTGRRHSYEMEKQKTSYYLNGSTTSPKHQRQRECNFLLCRFDGLVALNFLGDLYYMEIH